MIAGALLGAYAQVAALPKWQRSSGRSFAFFHFMPGWDQGTFTSAYNKFLCETTAHSFHVVVERSQRYVCPSFLNSNFLIAPYCGVDDLQPKVWQHASWPRNNLLYWKGTCSRVWSSDPVGKRMRLKMSSITANVGSDVKVQCAWDPDHKGYMTELADSKYCLVMPGHSQSARRITEVVLSGCVPVLLGPPWPSMPFAHAVSYKDFAIFVNVTDYQDQWMLPGESPPHWHIDAQQRTKHASDATWWLPDANVYDHVVNLKAAEVVDYLRLLTPSILNAKQERLWEQSNLFFYSDRFTQDHGRVASATDVIAQALCRWSRGS